MLIAFTKCFSTFEFGRTLQKVCVLPIVLLLKADWAVICRCYIMLYSGVIISVIGAICTLLTFRNLACYI